MNKLTLLAVILTAMPAWSAESATLAPKGERPDVRKIERELREFVDAQAAASPEVAELEREIADLKDQQRSFRNADSFHHTYGREPEFASDEQIEAEESLREANLRLHRARDLKDMDPSYFEDAIAKRESRRQLMLDDFAADWLKRNEERYGKLKDILFPRSIAQVEGEGPSVVQSRSYAPKRSPSFMGEIKPEPELVAPVN
jgi:hypothetical protein